MRASKMADTSEREKIIAKALNSARGANILDDNDSDNIGEIITEYFTTPNGAADEDESSDEEENASDDSDKGEDDSQTEDNTDSEPEDSGLVETAAVTVDVDICDSNVSADIEKVKVDNFDCKCKLRSVRNGGCCDADCEETSTRLGCVAQFSTDEILARRMDMAEFNEAEKDMILLGVLAGTPMNTGEKTHGKLYRQKPRQHSSTSYIIDSKIVCRETFKFIYGISQNKLTALLKHYRQHGVTPRQKKWGGRRFNTKSFTPDDVKRTVNFLQQFAEDHALVLPGRVPGFKRSDLKILPSSQSKAAVWRHYRQITVARGLRAMGKSSFFKFWELHTPFIIVGKPMTDLCWQCKRNNEKIRRTSHLPEEDRMTTLQEQLNHLRIVEEERKFYNSMVQDAKGVAAAAQIDQLGPHPPNTMPGRMHYSFDFAQQVHLPSSPLQPGPIYFLVPRKCGIFGVCAEAIPQQINYLIDEGMSSGKGSNMVISLLHHFFEHFGLGEVAMDLHCDNCSGQNKNKFVLWYLAWRVLRGLHSNITVNFMPAGHTKFAPDWCFGLLKRRFRVSEVHCLQDLCHVVESSTRRGINRSQIVGTERGEIRVTVYDWHTYFDGWFRPLKGIKALHHFRFSADNPGMVFCRKTLDDQETGFELSFDAATVQQRLTNTPPIIKPPGLPEARKAYLRQQIRQFVRPGAQDILCP